MIKSLSGIMAAVLLGVTGVRAEVPVSMEGVLCAGVIDDAGSFIPKPHVYIFSENDQRSFEIDGTEGAVSMKLPPGRYRLYSALTRPQGDYTDHFASPEAHIRVVAGDQTSVLLKLNRSEPKKVYLSEYARKKMGLAPEVAQYLN